MPAVAPEPAANMESVSRADLLGYCRIDDDDPLADTAVKIAESVEAYLVRQDIPVLGVDGRVKLCVMAWTLHQVDHPGEETPRGVREMIQDLKFNR